MDDPQLNHLAGQWANDVLVWVGFGTLVGLLAKAIMPGRDPGGSVTTILMGIAGTVIGSGTLMYFWDIERPTPLSPLGFISATLGAALLLAFYRLLAGYYFDEGAPRRVVRVRRAPRRRRAYASDDLVETRYLD